LPPSPLCGPQSWSVICRKRPLGSRDRLAEIGGGSHRAGIEGQDQVELAAYALLELGAGHLSLLVLTATVGDQQGVARGVGGRQHPGHPHRVAHPGEREVGHQDKIGRALQDLLRARVRRPRQIDHDIVELVA
jgi:hypothetical protein